MDRNHQGVNRGSSQIWGPYLAMRQQERDMSGLFYRVKNVRVSPYLELQADSLYENGSYGDGFAHLDANPYLRFFSIFDPLLSPDDSGYDEFDTALADILLHYLADLDLKMGMSSYDFYRSFLVREMEAGVFGALDELSAFSYMEKQEIASHLLRFYHTGDGLIGTSVRRYASQRDIRTVRRFPDNDSYTGDSMPAFCGRGAIGIGL